MWDDNDLEDLGLTKYGIRVSEVLQVTKPRRVFKAWFEDWEREASEKEDVVNEQKFITKYGNLEWEDPDEGRKLWAHNTYVAFMKDKTAPPRLRSKRRYNIAACYPEYAEYADGKDNEEWEPWSLYDGADIYDQIIEWYEQHPDPSIVITKKGDS